MRKSFTLFWVLAFGFLAIFAPGALFGQEKVSGSRVPVIVDTDLGSDVDDAFALALLLASPEIDLRGVTTVTGDTKIRALMACRLLTAAERREVPVAVGAAPQVEQAIVAQHQYYYHPGVIFNRTSRPVKDSAVEFLYQRLKAEPGTITILALGPLTNIARLFDDHPDCKPWIKRLVVMGGAIRVGYENKPPVEVEWNIKNDIKAAQKVFAAGVPITLVPLDATASAKLDEPSQARLFQAYTLLTMQIQSLTQMGDGKAPVLFDPVAATACFSERFCKWEDRTLAVDDKGFIVPALGKANTRVALTLDAPAFLAWYVDRVAGFGKQALPKPPGNLANLVPQGKMPHRVHAFEDYETDIERRWWMTGKAETVNVPPGSKRACRAILTQDFDDRMGDMGTMSAAVIFNPVPGPPMGKNPRLSFRYWLKGTDTLRVQIYSLTNGYHRYLSLKRLPEGKWQDATVDMTQVRRPDGSGGPLSENERIDDIQFYVDPRAELLIDDVILYDAAAVEEKRPFPRNLLYTGLFDTGKQGKEWSGDFQIVDKPAPHSWKAAKSVDLQGVPEIRLSFRGERIAGAKTHLFFRYHLTGANSLTAILTQRSTKAEHRHELKSLKRGEWAETIVEFASARLNDRFDELRFVLPRGAEILIDDVLVYGP